MSCCAPGSVSAEGMSPTCDTGLLFTPVRSTLDTTLPGIRLQVGVSDFAELPWPVITLTHSQGYGTPFLGAVFCTLLCHSPGSWRVLCHPLSIRILSPLFSQRPVWPIHWMEHAAPYPHPPGRCLRAEDTGSILYSCPLEAAHPDCGNISNRLQRSGLRQGE